MRVCFVHSLRCHVSNATSDGSTVTQVLKGLVLLAVEQNEDLKTASMQAISNIALCPATRHAIMTEDGLRALYIEMLSSDLDVRGTAVRAVANILMQVHLASRIIVECFYITASREHLHPYLHPYLHTALCERRHLTRQSHTPARCMLVFLTCYCVPFPSCITSLRPCAVFRRRGLAKRKRSCTR